MYGFNDLKSQIIITDSEVECPVKDCDEKVERQRQFFKREQKFKCPKHNIYISPSTFEYESELDNTLWTDTSDLERFKNIKEFKRESRIARENSEDAVTWNVFRYLEKKNLLSPFLSTVSEQKHSSSELVLWSYSPSEKDDLDLLNKARKEFGEKIKFGSEPDIIVITDKELFFIEAKVLAGNDTSGSGETLEKHLNEPKKYISGADNWFSDVFKSDYQTVVKEQKYELLRFWLLGTWMAEQIQVPFYLINLVMKEREINIENEFGKHIIQNENRKFKRITWEDIFEFINKTGLSDPETEKLKNYFNNKALGYNSNHELIKAFFV